MLDVNFSPGASPLLGDSAAMRELRALIANIAPTEADVLILGGMGFGKELVAQALHQGSARSGGELLAVDIGALPESTFESALFGHRRGSFTDAKTARLGRFQAAWGGTLFLDEIGMLSLANQAKLINALKRRQVTPLGADKPEAADVRIVSATNPDEAALFHPERFHPDLLYRLNTLVIQRARALALETVARRAESQASFVGNYRRVSELPEPRPEPVLLTALFARLEQLVAAQWRARGGDATFTVEPASLTLMADPGQLAQALLNLLKNAAEATAATAGTAEVPRVNLSARLVRGGRLLLTVRDNGPGVPAGLERDIFLPFFSARAETALVPVSANAPAPASKEVRGIGLAVVRSLVHSMGGTVRCVKTLRGGASFVISF